MDNPTTIRATVRYATAAQRWAAIVRRAAGADGIFYYAVRTTGVYCRPSCGARRALRKNVRFFDSAADRSRRGAQIGNQSLAQPFRFRRAHRNKFRRTGIVHFAEDGARFRAPHVKRHQIFIFFCQPAAPS